MGLFNRKPKEAERRTAVLDGDGSYSFREVVGESHYRQALQAIIRKAPKDERAIGEVFMPALVVKDPGNAFDPNAVAVFIDGSLVGYIARDMTDAFHKAMAQVAELGYGGDGFGCKAVVGWNAASADPVVGVRLDLQFSEE